MNTIPAGTYWSYVEDENGCKDSIMVTVDQPDSLWATFTVKDVLCFGDSTGSITVDEVFNSSGTVSYFWDLVGAVPNPPSHINIASGLPAGTYLVTIQDEYCSNQYEFDIEENPDITFVELGFNPAHCRVFNYQNGGGQVFAAAAGGVADYTYEWEELSTGTTTDNSTWGGRNPAEYRITVTDDVGCIKTEVITLDSISPIASFNVISDDLNSDCKGTAPVEVEFENTSQNFTNQLDPSGDTTFFWRLDSANTSYTITHDYLYRPDTTFGPRGSIYLVEVCLKALNTNGCEHDTCKTLTIFEPIRFVPVNIFTPNNDGNNDIFTFSQYAASISEFNCVIVNRWGVKVGEITDVASGWNGDDQNGDPCKDGTYFYTYEVVTDDGTEFAGQGNVTLVRGN